MSLERIQASTNRQRVDAGNLSASNDPTQWAHDGREQLIKGAELAAAGRTLGMSEEETLAAVSRQYRRQRRADDSVTPNDILRKMTQAVATTREQVGAEEIKGVRYSDTSDVDEVFGMTDYEMGLRDLDVDNGVDSRPLEHQEVGNRYYKIHTDAGEVVPTTGHYFNLVRPEEDPFYKPDVAPKSALKDALSAVEKEKSKRSGLQGTLSRVFGGGKEVDAELDTASEALSRHLQAEGPQDARIGRAVVRQDNQNYNPEVEEANYYRAETDALAERRRLYGPGGQGARADGNIARIGDIHSIGKVYEETHKVNSANDAIQGQIARRHDGVFVDPSTGNTVAVQGPEMPPVLSGDRTPNNTGTADNLNAPQTAREWLTEAFEQQFGDRKGASPTDRIQQIDITGATTTAANRIRDYYRKVGLIPSSPGPDDRLQVPSNIRSVAELQKVVDRVVQATGGQMAVADPENPGRQMPAGPRQQVSAALGTMGMTLGEQRQLGQALYQLDAASRSSVNQNPTGVYLSRTGQPTEGVTFDSADVLDSGMAKAKIARVAPGSRIRVGTAPDGKAVRSSIRTQLSQLPSEDAQRPYIGQVEGEKPRVNRFNSTGESNSADAAIAVRKQAESRSKGKGVDAERTRANQVKAVLATEREKRDNTKRADAASELIAQLPPNARRTRLGGR